MVLFWQQIHEIDQQVTLALNSLHCGFTDSIMVFFSKIPVWIPMYVIVAVFLFLRLDWKRALIALLSIVLTFLLCDQIANLFKDGIARLRPCHDDFMVGEGLRILEKKGGLYGFFSGHAANAFGFAVSSYMAFRNDKRLKYKGYAAWIFFWAAMVSLSRIFVGKHYAGDVTAGIVAGTLIGLACGFTARWIMSRLPDRKPAGMASADSQDEAGPDEESKEIQKKSEYND